MPPSVLPAVATAMALQNRSGLSLSSPNSAGSEPTGSSVAEMNAATNSELSPYSGSASTANRDSIQVGMRAHVIGGPSPIDVIWRKRTISGTEMPRAYNRASFFGTPSHPMQL